MESQIHLENLFPNFELVGSIPQTTEALSATFIAFLLSVTVIFLLISAISLIKTLHRVSWLSRLLKGQDTPEKVAEERENLKNRARKAKNVPSHLWLEFDETLIPYGNDDEPIKLYNTYDADHFFNNSTLAYGITESRLLAAVPGFLTAIGVIGTFVGLQLGLSGLNLGQELPVSEMKEGLGVVISGAKTAFITSVWGVTLSVLFNFLEKGFERRARGSVRKLQQKIDELFPRFSPEVQLCGIREHTEESRKSLQGLAEQIGVKMQESVLEATAHIQSGLEASLQKIMAPAIEKLVNETSSGSQKALESLVESFLEKFSENGKNQRDAMDSASSRVEEAVDSLRGTITSFIGDLQNSQQASDVNEEQRNAIIKEQIQSIKDNTDKLLVGFNESVKTLKGSEKEFAESMQSQAKKFTDDVGDSIKELVAASGNVIDQGMSLQEMVNESIAENKMASDRMNDAAAAMASSVENIKSFGAYLKQAADNLSKSISNVVTETGNLSNQNQLALQQLNEYRNQMLSDSAKFDEVAKRLSGTVDKAGNAFDNLTRHQQEYLTALKGNVQELSEQMSNLLSEYANQANAQTAQHLKVWAEGTTQYASQMNTAMQSLASIVDDIEVKLGK